MAKHTACLVCNSTNIAPLAGYYNTKGLVKCKACSFVFMENIPTLEELDAHYSTYAYGGSAVLSPITIKSYQQLLDELEPYRNNGRILDVGCGRGWFLEEAKKRGWEVYGTEYSTRAIELCEEKGIAMKAGELDASMFEPGYFDVITSFEVIEHINNPHDKMALVAQFLRKGGLFYCTTPNFNSILRHYLKADYHVIDYPEHLSYYTRKTLNKVLCQHGFRVKRFRSTGISLTAIRRAKQKRQAAVQTAAPVPAPAPAAPEPAPKTTTPALSADEALRRNIDKKAYLQLAKATANQLLTWTNWGATLKGYYEKI